MTQYNSFYPEDMLDDELQFDARFRQAMIRVNTCLPVIVEAVQGGGVAPVGTLTCKIAISQVDQKGDAIDNTVLLSVPYSRIQGGRNAVIIDPKPGDIGWCIFSQRDITAFQNVKKISPPGSKRIFNLGDAIYLGGILNDTPIQYIHFEDNQITVHSPTKIVLDAPEVEINASTSTTINSPVININGQLSQGGGSYGGNAEIAGTLDAGEDVTVNGISLKSHTHGGVDPGSGNSGVPNGN